MLSRNAVGASEDDRRSVWASAARARQCRCRPFPSSQLPRHDSIALQRGRLVGPPTTVVVRAAGSRCQVVFKMGQLIFVLFATMRLGAAERPRRSTQQNSTPLHDRRSGARGRQEHLPGASRRRQSAGAYRYRARTQRRVHASQILARPSATFASTRLSRDLVPRRGCCQPLLSSAVALPYATQGCLKTPPSRVLDQPRPAPERN